MGNASILYPPKIATCPSTRRYFLDEILTPVLTEVIFCPLQCAVVCVAEQKSSSASEQLFVVAMALSDRAFKGQQQSVLDWMVCVES